MPTAPAGRRGCTRTSRTVCGTEKACQTRAYSRHGTIASSHFKQLGKQTSSTAWQCRGTDIDTDGNAAWRSSSSASPSCSEQGGEQFGSTRIIWADIADGSEADVPARPRSPQEDWSDTRYYSYYQHDKWPRRVWSQQPARIPSADDSRVQMQSAHVEAVLSAIVIGDAAQRRGRSTSNAWIARSTPCAEEVARLERCIKILHEIAQMHDSTWSVLPFGSHVSGLTLKGSDLDATVILPESNGEDAGSDSAVDTLQWSLQPIFKKHPSFEVTKPIFNARVPILKLRFEDSLDVDLSCHNWRPLQNTGLITAYSDIDPVVKDLILSVKTWAKAAKVCGASDRNLSCYSFTLLVIYYMQVDPYVELPCLSTAAFDLTGRTAPGHLPPAWSCKVPLPVLLARFFMFYSEVFDWGREVVSVRLGCRTDARSREFYSLAFRSSWRMHIEDPFDLKRNLHCVLGAKEEHLLGLAFVQGAALVREVACTAEEILGLPRVQPSPRTSYEYQEESLASPHLIAAITRRQQICTSSAQEDVTEPQAVTSYGMPWWCLLVGSCFAYTFYSIYCGQLLRLGIALSSLLFVLAALERRRRLLIATGVHAECESAEFYRRTSESLGLQKGSAPRS